MKVLITILAFATVLSPAFATDLKSGLNQESRIVQTVVSNETVEQMGILLSRELNLDGIDYAIEKRGCWRTKCGKVGFLVFVEEFASPALQAPEALLESLVNDLQAYELRAVQNNDALTTDQKEVFRREIEQIKSQLGAFKVTRARSVQAMQRHVNFAFVECEDKLFEPSCFDFPREVIRAEYRSLVQEALLIVRWIYGVMDAVYVETGVE
jgi:hypothetical protein